MIKTREFISPTAPNPLCETYSTVGADLVQTETGMIYGSPVVDVIAGYDGDGNPYSRFHYTEEGIDSENITLEDTLSALAELGVKEDA